jgi:hypothetical protein
MLYGITFGIKVMDTILEHPLAQTGVSVPKDEYWFR